MCRPPPEPTRTNTPFPSTTLFRSRRRCPDPRRRRGMSARLAPVVNDLSRPFWDAAEEGRLSLPHCVATGRPFWPPAPASPLRTGGARSEEHTSELQSLIRNSYAVFCLKKKNIRNNIKKQP